MQHKNGGADGGGDTDDPDELSSCVVSMNASVGLTRSEQKLKCSSPPHWSANRVRSGMMACLSDNSWNLWTQSAPRGLRGSNALWFMCFISALYKLFVCVINFLHSFFLLYFFPYVSFICIYFLVYFLTYQSTPSRIDVFHFQAGDCRRRPNLALVFWVHFVL